MLPAAASVSASSLASSAATGLPSEGEIRGEVRRKEGGGGGPEGAESAAASPRRRTTAPEPPPATSATGTDAAPRRASPSSSWTGPARAKVRQVTGWDPKALTLPRSSKEAPGAPAAAAAAAEAGAGDDAECQPGCRTRQSHTPPSLAPTASAEDHEGLPSLDVESHA